MADIRIIGGTPTAPAGGTASNLNDNNSATACSVAGANWTGVAVASRIVAQIDYATAKTISIIEAVQISFSAGSDAGFALYYSTDGSTWTQLGTSFTVSTTPQDVQRTGNVTARYVAIAPGAINDGGATLSIGDLNGYTPFVAKFNMPMLGM